MKVKDERKGKEKGKKYDQRKGRDIQQDLKEKMARTEKCLKEPKASTLQTLTCCHHAMGYQFLRTCQSLNVLWSQVNTSKFAQNREWRT